MFTVATMFVFASQVAIIASAIFAGKKPHNLILATLSFSTLVLLACRSFLAENFVLLDLAACLLALLAVFLDKIVSVIHYQKDAVLPTPYSMYDKAKSYKPSFLEIGNQIAAFAQVVFITDAVVIFQLYIWPWIIGLF
jgi:hypothetical protein